MTPWSRASAWLRSNPVAAAGIGVMIAALGLLVGRGGALSSAEAELAARQSLAGRLARNVKHAVQLPEQAAALATARAAVDARIIRGAEIGLHSEYFYRLERESGAKLTELRPQSVPAGPKGATPRFQAVPFTLSLQGTWPQLLAFHRLLEGDARYVRVRTMTIVANPANRREPLKSTVALELLCLP